MPYQAAVFAKKYHFAWEAALKDSLHGGISGLELEWNLLDSQFRPLQKVGTGEQAQSFVDYLIGQVIPPDMLKYSQLEVFHWMIEWATRPYFHLKGSIYESRLMETVLLRALDKAGQKAGEKLHAWHGNLLYPLQVGHGSIPSSWHLAKRRYLERCVDLYGSSLATAGIHSNLSLPEPLLAMEFMHLTPTERSSLHFDDYKSQVYITGTRLLRAFAALFIAASASTPMQAALEDGQPVVYLSENESVRSLTFPNPAALDVPELYRSYSDYLRMSYELVRHGIRFGNNNWTPVRARSFAEPVERLISITSEQLEETYARGLYVLHSQFAPPHLAGQDPSAFVDEMARMIEQQNLLARINLPMARVEVRTDDGGGSLEMDIANLTLKYLLLLHGYADPEFGRSFRYDAEDIQRARRNEDRAAQRGLAAEIENPFTGKPVLLGEFLRWTLEQIRPLALELEMWEDLAPLREMAHGCPSQAENLRQRIRQELGCQPGQRCRVPVELLIQLAAERSSQVERDLQAILADLPNLGKEEARLVEILPAALQAPPNGGGSPLRLDSLEDMRIDFSSSDTTSEIVAVAQELVRIPSVTACPEERLDEVWRGYRWLCSYLSGHGLEVREFNDYKYPALVASFPGRGPGAPVTLSGHFDVVAPQPDDSQFSPYIDGDYLWGRGAADMKTVVATYLVWMKDRLAAGGPYPPVNLMLIGNEENGEGEPAGTPHVFEILSREGVELPGLFIAGERTGEKGNELWGEICTENRGVMRFDLIARGQQGHSGTAGSKRDLVQVLLSTRQDLESLFQSRLTLSAPDGWQSQVHFPFLQTGTPGVYNVTAASGVLGVEIRPIPQDDLGDLEAALRTYCQEHDLELSISVHENGIACSPSNPYLLKLIEAVRQESGAEPRLGRKLPGTSARFAPAGQSVVWGQAGIGPHAANERHFIPSILPYYQSLNRLGELLK